jgi:lipoprotein-anchoring transpeptidase ErfK/SrfK
MLLDRIKNDEARWTSAAAEAEFARFDAATDRIEAEIARAAHESIGGFRGRGLAIKVTHDIPGRQSRGRHARHIMILGIVGFLGVLLTALAVFAFRSGQIMGGKKDERAAAGLETGKKGASRSTVDTYELAPGIDGGSSADELPYFLRRQLVYYRSTYGPGMIVVDRSQRFLYLMLPQSRALRYGVGIGGECPISAGLYKIQSKSEWPAWFPSATLRERGGYPARMQGGPGNPLGAYAMYFENNYPGIHGTNAPKSIGHAPSIGCLRLVNDDVVDLAKRVDISTAVVVLN